VEEPQVSRLIASRQANARTSLLGVLFAQLHHAVLHRVRGLVRAAARYRLTVPKPLGTLLSVALQPLVTLRPAYPETGTLAESKAAAGSRHTR
jgi:hypothetical protein